jgi:hypothetical protein
MTVDSQKDKKKNRPKKKRNIGDPLPPKLVLIEYLRELAKKLGRSPKIQDVREAFRRGEGYSFATYQEVFGTHLKALEAAKLSLTRYYEPDRDDILKEICFLSLELEKPLRATDIMRAIGKKKFPYSTRAISLHFKTITEAIKIADASQNRFFGGRLQTIKFEGATEEILKDQLRSLAKELGRSPTITEVEEFCKKGKCYSPRPFIRVFGSFTKAVRAAGLKPILNAKGRKFSEEKMLDILRDLAKKLGRTPKTRDIENIHGIPKPQTYIDYFGGFNNALEQAGLKINLKRSYTEEEIIQALRELTKKLGRRPNNRDIVEASKRRECASDDTIRNKFGSMEKAFKRAEIEELLNEEKKAEINRKKEEKKKKQQNDFNEPFPFY